MMQSYDGYFEEDGRFVSNGTFVKVPTRKRIIINVLDEDAGEEKFNAVTVAALLEAERIGKDPTVKRYSDVEEALRELKS